MEYFFVDDKFYCDLDDLSHDVMYWEDLDELEDLDDEWEIEVIGSKYEPMYKFDLSHVLNTLDLDRLPEDNQRIEDELLSVLRENINFDKINENMPKLYYPDWKIKTIITKNDLIEWNK